MSPLITTVSRFLGAKATLQMANQTSTTTFNVSNGPDMDQILPDICRSYGP